MGYPPGVDPTREQTPPGADTPRTRHTHPGADTPLTRHTSSQPDPPSGETDSSILECILVEYLISRMFVRCVKGSKGKNFKLTKHHLPGFLAVHVHLTGKGKDLGTKTGIYATHYNYYCIDFKFKRTESYVARLLCGGPINGLRQIKSTHSKQEGIPIECQLPILPIVLAI